MHCWFRQWISMLNVNFCHSFLIKKAKAHDLDYQSIRACVINLCAFHRSCPPDPMLSGQGKTLWCTKRGGYGGSNPPLNLQSAFQLCMHKNTVQALLLYLWNSKFCAGKRTNLYSIIAFCWTQLGDFCPPDALAPPILNNSWSTTCETPPLRSPGTHVVQPIPISIPSRLLAVAPQTVMCGHPMLDIARHVICTK